MGADLYVDKVFKQDPRIDVVGKKLDQVRENMRNLPDDTPDDVTKRYERREKALLDAYMRIYDNMFCVENGYFRDSYNSSNLLWVLNLSYWDWLGGFLDGKGLLHPQHARIILDKIESIPVTAARVKRHLEARKIKLGDNGKSPDEEFKDWLDYFVEKRKRFIRFLRMAIEADSPILCSI
ncbi:hypothetical protein CEE36_08830 [candidate division TA06 bacterium B3_TA06]|uniref:Uncharacterized protein n=1 Tax=candidate division TA06 bacterium B3_TA06 TaxID=2012487 RepID=A0A532V187_UNCT6|nr:MAG: hypothetical protein CEE36_08830 [candidate division TA06 bacterium B3_TA06]